MIGLRNLIDHVLWADATALAAIATLPDSSPEHSQAERLYAHLAAAAHIWYARLEGRPPSHPVWPDLPIDEARTLAGESLNGLRDWAAKGPEALATVIEYRTSTGQPFRNTVADVITQVVLHGSYHRGQLALLVRQGGGTPVNTDYILYARNGACS